MTDTKLNAKEILELKARAHHLHPVVMVGQQGPDGRGHQGNRCGIDGA